MAKRKTKKAMTMDNETAKALEKSIAHWRQNSEAETPDDASIAGEVCALCIQFQSWETRCAGCPVAARAGCGMCLGTPFVKAANDHLSWQMGVSDGRELFQKDARAELAFLESLRDPKP